MPLASITGFVAPLTDLLRARGTISVVETLSVIAALVAAVVALAAGFWAFRAVVLSKRQLKVAQREADAAEAQRALKPRLIVREQRSIRNDKDEVEAEVMLIRGLNSVMLTLEVENEGNRKATNVSVEFLIEGIKGVGMDQGIAVTASGYTKNRVPGELAPGEHIIIGQINGSAGPGTVRIKWIARCNEGSFPQKDDPSSDPWGELLIRLIGPH